MVYTVVTLAGLIFAVCFVKAKQEKVRHERRARRREARRREAAMRERMQSAYEVYGEKQSGRKKAGT